MNNARAAALLAVAMAAATPAYAGDIIGDLAQQTGLSERKVRMIVGNRTPFAEYPYTYYRSLRQFKAAVGEENYQRLTSGQPMLPRNDQARARVAKAGQADTQKAL